MNLKQILLKFKHEILPSFDKQTRLMANIITKQQLPVVEIDNQFISNQVSMA